ncbi:MAG: hypothetical protein PVI30_01725 [Myxococcales bacterium]|jgi:succinate dehydrogenase / fumarate reductase cytochrome b subunit
MVARLHSLLGLVPLAAFVVFHLWDLWPVLEGRDAWLATRRDGGRLAVAALVIAPLVVHAALGLLRLRTRGSRPQVGGRAGLARVQLGTGLVVLAFLLFHLAQVWGGVRGPHRAPGAAAYATLWSELGRPGPLLAYLMGVTALSFHLGHGLSRLPGTWGGGANPGGRLVARLVGGVCGFALWLAWLQLLAHFAVGGSLLGDADAARELLRR